uniref:Malate dehydrogenase, cytoplasmic n=1 Tax=Henneguya salminicola TaxID=69463 RepID=A0A6G3ME28_HENSL
MMKFLNTLLFKTNLKTKIQTRFINHINLFGLNKPEKVNKPVNILVVGAAGQISYSLLPRLSRGEIYGPDTPVVLKMFDLPRLEKVMAGVKMELEDCAFTALKDVQIFTNPSVAFKNNDIIIMLASFMELSANMVRADLLKSNISLYKEFSEYLKESTNKDVKILMAANPVNSLCLLLIDSLKGFINPTNFTGLCRLDHDRSIHMIAHKLSVAVNHVRKVIVWGNHSNTMYPDIRFAEVLIDKEWKKVMEVLKDKEWAKNIFVPTVRGRGLDVRKARGKSSCIATSNAIVNHLRNWLVGTEPNDWVSMGIYTDYAYNFIPPGLVYSEPCICSNGSYTVVNDLQIDEFTREMILISAKDLLQERDAIANIIK